MKSGAFIFWFLIFLGGGMGSLARYWATSWSASVFGPAFPLGTLVVNVSGSLLIGTLFAFAQADGHPLAHPTTSQFLLIGLLGGFTTFSSFSLQTLQLAQAGRWDLAAWNSLLSFGLSLLAVWLGHAIGLAMVGIGK